MRSLLLLLAACSGGSTPPDAWAQCHIADKACWTADAAPSCPTLLFGVRLCDELPSSDCQRPLAEDGTGLECPVTNFSHQPCWCHTGVVSSEGWCMPASAGQDQ